jgi:hypothetical protein
MAELSRAETLTTIGALEYGMDDLADAHQDSIKEWRGHLKAHKELAEALDLLVRLCVEVDLDPNHEAYLEWARNLEGCPKEHLGKPYGLCYCNGLNGKVHDIGTDGCIHASR